MYEGKVFTQYVIVEMKNRSKVALYDTSKRVKENNLGTNVKINISVPVSGSIDLLQYCRYEIVPVRYDEEHFLGPAADIYGKIDRIIEKDQGPPQAIIDVGDGTINLLLDKVGNNYVYNEKDRLSIFQIGVCIAIKGAQLYLESVNNDKLIS